MTFVKRSVSLLFFFIFATCLLIPCAFFSANWILKSHYIEKLINTKSEKLNIHYSSAQIMASGSIQIKDFVLRTQDENVKWELKLNEARFRIAYFKLIYKKFEVNSIQTSGVTFKLSPQVVRIREGFPKIEMAKLKVSENLNPSSSPWEIEISNIQIKDLQEIWINQYRLQSKMEIEGHFYLFPGRKFTLQQARLKLNDSELYSGKERIFGKLKGTIDVKIPSHYLQQKVKIPIWNTMRLLTHFTGRIEGPELLSVYFRAAKKIHFTRAFGDFSGGIKISKGKIESGSQWIIPQLDWIGESLGVQYQGSGYFGWSVKEEHGKPKSDITMEIDPFKAFSHQVSHSLLFSGKNLRIRVTSEDLQISRLFEKINADVHLEYLKIQNLTVLNDFLPEASEFKILKGTGEMKGDFQLSSEKITRPGKIIIKSNQLHALYGKAEVSGNVYLKVHVKTSVPQLKEIDLSGTQVQLSQFRVLNPQNSEKGWSASGTIVQASLGLDPSLSFNGNYRFQLSDARPVIHFIYAGLPLPFWAKPLLGLTDIRSAGEVFFKKNEISIPYARLQSPQLDLEVRLRMREDSKLGTFLIHHGLIPIGVELQNRGVSVRLFANRNWFNQPLDDFSS